ncbi:MAG: EAL domain-containing protein [Rhodocyclaceae bacterium]|nr:EAL domain-containing protein [Rhodocyclaceae bacterium]MBX3669078.1 EAL domain-containing protein [Rhodocyclaceae bacterium]
MIRHLQALASRRGSLRARVTLAIAAGLFGVGVAAGAIQASRRGAELEAQRGRTYAAAAVQIAERTGRGLRERLSDLRLYASLTIFGETGEDAERRDALVRLRAAVPQYLGLAYVSQSGLVLAATGDFKVGSDLALLDEFRSARLDAYLGVLNNRKESRNAAPELVLAVPARGTAGQLAGVLMAHLSVDWMLDEARAVLAPLRENRDLDVLVVARDGRVLSGPAELVNSSVRDLATVRARAQSVASALEAWPSGERFLVGYAPVRAIRELPDPDWTIMVRESASSVFADVAALQKLTLVLSSVSALSMALLASLLAGWILRPLRVLIAAARQVHEIDGRVILPLAARKDDFGDLARALQSMLDGLARRTRELRETQRTQTTLLANLPGFAYRCRADPLWTLDYVSDGVLAATGYGASEALGRPSLDHDDRIAAEDRPRVHTELRRALAARTPYMLEYRLMGRDGQLRWIGNRGTGVFGEDGSLLSLEGFAADITERHNAVQALQEREAQMRLVTENAPAGMAFVDVQRRIHYANSAYARMLGWEADKLPGRPLAEVLGGDSMLEVEPHLRRALAGEHDTYERVAAGRDGLQVHFEITMVPNRNARGWVDGVHIMARDITDQRRFEQRIQYLATRDTLTRLPNRSLLLDRLNQALARAQRVAGMLAVMVLDLDRFKNINDSLGHQTGDALLRMVAQRITSCLREQDSVARQGGDEFILLLPGLDQQGDALRVAEKVLGGIAEPCVINGTAITIGGSLGVALYPDDGADAETLLKNADVAMYHAKESGRNHCQFFTQRMNDLARQRLTLEAELRRALEQGGLYLCLQPVMDTASGVAVGFEALARWQHATLGAVSPVQFIPIAEESGLILGLGTWALREACRAAHRLHTQGKARWMAVNVSARQFRHKDFVATVDGVLAETGLDPHLLVLEITESMLMEHTDEAIATLRALADRGIELAIDDFGTGYSSLSYLRRLPIHKIKIDRSFVRELPADGESGAIVRAIVGLATSLGMKTVAEGVETPAQFDYLRNNACTYVQGYLFSEPRRIETWNNESLEALEHVSDAKSAVA